MIRRILQGIGVGLVVWSYATVAGAVDILGTQAQIGWTNSTGPVAGYEVYVKTNAGAFAYLRDVTTPLLALDGTAGETKIVKVRAFAAGKTAFSVYSPDSDPFVFTTLTQPGKPTFLQILAAWLRALFGRA